MDEGLNIYDGVSLLEIFKVMWYAGGNAKNMYIILSAIIFFIAIGYYVDFQYRNITQILEPLSFRYKGKRYKAKLYKQRKNETVFYVLKNNSQENPFCYFKKESDGNWTLVNGQMKKEQQVAIIRALDKRFNTLSFIKKILQEFCLSVLKLLKINRNKLGKM